MQASCDKKINLCSLLIGLIGIMPIVDTVSGALHDSLPVGQMYRIGLFVYIVFLLMKKSQKDFLPLMGLFLWFVVEQATVSAAGGYIAKSIQDTVKLFCPIMGIVLLHRLIQKRKIETECILSVFNIWCVLYPILIIVPGLLSIGNAAYDGTVGWKGLFYAVNEISFIISTLIMYCFWKLKKCPSMRNVIELALNCYCIIRMGTKTGYATIALFGVIFLFSFWNSRNTKKSFELLALILIAALVVILNMNRILAAAGGIFERWQYQRSLSYTTVDFLFSMRLRRLSDALNIFLGKGYFLLGWGFGGELAGYPNMEMDFLDILFRTGLAGFVLVFGFYLYVMIRAAKTSKRGMFMLLWELALSFGAGHVLFYGQSGMMLALICVFAVDICKDRSGKHLVVRHVSSEKNL